MAVTRQGDELARRFNALMTRLRLATAAAVTAAWDRLDHYNEEQVAGFVAYVAPLVNGAQAQTAATVDAYLAAFMTAETGVSEPVKGITVPVIRNGTPLEEVYRRPFVTVWSALKAGTPWEDAVSAGRARVESTVEMDVMLAHRSAATEWMGSDDRVVGYRRVLSGSSCGLCAIASTQRYHSEDLMPIHNRCDCTVDPIIAPRRVSQVVDRDRLSALREQGLGNDRSALSHTRVLEDGQTVAPKDLPDVQVREHGELGPVLTDAADSFTGEHQIA